MREYELVIDEALKKGLSPVQMVPFNSQFLYECLGFRCGKGGLEPQKILTNPIPSIYDLYYSWPFPQFISGELYRILVVRDLTGGRDLVYSVSEDCQTLVLIATLPYDTYGMGGLMEVADFGEYVFMTNGVVAIIWNPATLAWQAFVSTANIPLMTTVCNLKGQAIGGGVKSVWYDCDETFYAWSKIGYMSFIPDEDNEAGYRRCPYGGTVYHTRRIGDYVIGYSSKGLVRISPVNSPAATYGFDEIGDIGLINQGAVNGNLQRHIFVGEDYILREVALHGDLSKQYNVLELGYQQYMKQLAGEDIIVTYEPSDQNFYIGNSQKTFLLSPIGLTEVMQHPSAVWRCNNNSYMLPDTLDADKPLICSEPFDMGYKGQKTVFVIESDAFSNTGGEVSVDYANDLVNWKTTAFTPINNMGIGTLIAAGNNFRFRLRFTSIDEEARIGYIRARYKMTDLRGIRGVYAPPPRGQ
jgi:hypothetical protein